MVKTKIVKTKKIIKISIFFIFFLRNTRIVLGCVYKKNFFANRQKKFMNT